MNIEKLRKKEKKNGKVREIEREIDDTEKRVQEIQPEDNEI